MKKSAAVIVALGVLFASAHPSASGPLGVYAIVERVVFEPNDNAPERIQVWGAFAYYDAYSPSGISARGVDGGLTVSAARRGYMYFRLPDSDAKLVRTEWADLKAVAGTGQAVAFGQWGYIGAFAGLQPDVRSNRPPYILERGPRNPQTDLRVRPASEPPSAPALYQTNAGMVKLREDGSHADIVKRLKAALKQ